MAEASITGVDQAILAKKAEAFLQETAPVREELRVGVLSPMDMQQDTALEYDSMVLLSKIEQLGIRFNDKMVQASAALALECLVNIANQLVEFTEQLPLAAAKRFSLDALITRDRAHYTHLGPHYIRQRRLVMEVFTELHLHQGAMRDPAVFSQLTQDLLRVSNVCLNICVKAFHAPEMRQQWSKIYSGFLVHLVKAAKEIQTT